MVPPIYTMIAEADHEKALKTKWLQPCVVYLKGDSFGSRSLIVENDRRAGSAICT